MNIKPNQTVKYASLNHPLRVFTGRVRAVHDDRAVVRHDGEPYLVTVPCHRLVIVRSASTRFAGHSA